MKLYELTYLISSNLSESELKSLQEKINSFILENQGTLNEIRESIKKKLEYPVKKQEMVYLMTLSFYLNSEKLESLEKKLKSENQIIHYMIFVKKPQKVTVFSKKISTVSFPKGPSKISEKPKKVEIKEIEKKLEEILGE